MSMSAAPSVSVQEAARRARVDERTVRRWISSGRLRAARGRGGWRISTAALTPFLAEPADIADPSRADITDTRTASADMSEAPGLPPAPSAEVSALSVALATIAEQRVEL